MSLSKMDKETKRLVIELAEFGILPVESKKPGGEKMTELSCPHCCGKLIVLQCEMPSGHTHQCEGCGALHTPHGFDN